MKALTLTSKGIELKEIKLEALYHGWARIKVCHTGICGSDTEKIFNRSVPDGQSMILGHEFYGYIDQLSSCSSQFKVGDMVTAVPLLYCGICKPCKKGSTNLCVQAQAIGRTLPGSFAEYVDVPVANLFAAVNSQHFELNVLADPLAVCIHAYKLARAGRRPTKCLVIGDGTIGCLLSWLLKKNSHDIWLSGKHEESLLFATQFGIKIVNTSDALDNFDIVFEAVGHAQHKTLDRSFDAVNWGGSMVVLGVFPSTYEYRLIARNLFMREIRLVGANSYYVEDFIEALTLIQDFSSELTKFISHRFVLSQFDEALSVLKSKHEYTMKVILEMGEQQL